MMRFQWTGSKGFIFIHSCWMFTQVRCLDTPRIASNLICGNFNKCPLALWVNFNIPCDEECGKQRLKAQMSVTCLQDNVNDLHSYFMPLEQ